mmetsp:Transcript_12018/g.13258  ORF Transcript_12018/g.13258 Transcript_12018/m.13258 type:complete len:299 (+) Transcript_12018:232-1128(+)
MFDGINRGESPTTILQKLASISGHQSRQYGIADVEGREITFSGSSNGAYKGGVKGSVGSLHYAIQGNVLAGACVIDAIEQATLEYKGDMPNILMAGMKAAGEVGGDGRCSCSQFNPTSCGCPIYNKKPGHIGGMIVARIGDIDTPQCNANGCADGTYFMNINVAFQSNSSPDPVTQLQQKFEAFRSTKKGVPDAVASSVDFNPSSIPPDGTSITNMFIRLVDYDQTPVEASTQIQVTHAPGSASLSTILMDTLKYEGSGVYSLSLRAGTSTGTDSFIVSTTTGPNRIILMPEPQLMYS